MLYPSATYRVQLNSDFTFKHLADIIDYLYELGVSTIYAAPVTTSQKDSMHGYDVVDPSVINPQIGTIEELRQLAAKLKTYNMNWLQDIVPNHMSFSEENQRLMDVLERGSDSSYYTYFDIDWQHKEAEGKLWIPVLGKDWQACLDEGEFTIDFSEQKGFQFQYHDRSYPLSVQALQALLTYMRESGAYQGLCFVMEDLIKGAQRKELSSWKKHKEKYSKEIHRQFSNDVRQVLEAIHKDKTRLAAVLRQQPYALTHWKSSEKQMNYRRFFAVNELICLRMEDKKVFDDYHSFFLYLYHEQLIQGIRLDHIDGLYHPLEYVERLRKKMGEDCYIIVEKILEYNEDIGSDWNIQGTSGYEFLSFSNRVLTDQRGAQKLKDFYHAFTVCNASYQDLVFEKKYAFLKTQMEGEWDNLVNLLVNLGLTNQVTLELKRIKKALGMFMAAFPVYRIYPFTFPIAEEALRFVDLAFQRACQHDNTYKAELTFIRSLFMEEQPDIAGRKMQFVMRLMQFTGPLAAKGVEDTTFYVYNPLISHNEVGDAPSELAITVEEFHEKMINRQKLNPFSLNNSSTHDTKRGEDARARINVLSHLTHEWEQLVMQWHEENKPFLPIVDNKQMPSLNDEYFIYQSLLGSFPEDAKADDSFMERSKQFILKALREAKVETTYTENNEQYESSCVQFIASILSPQHSFLKTFVPFLNKVMQYASIYSLTQLVIKSTAPGIPDIYQGSELWELSYVDPDNRRKVDYDYRKALLKEINSKTDDLLPWLKDRRLEGAEKLFVTKKLLQLRKEIPGVFIKGSYVPLEVKGKEGRCIAYSRSEGDTHVLVILPIGFDLDAEGNFQTSWSDVYIPLAEGLPSRWQNIFTGHEIKTEGAVAAGMIFSDFPVAVYRSIE